MIFETAVTMLKLRLGNNTLSDLDALIRAEMQVAQDTVLEGGEFLPWFLWKEDSSLVTVASTRELALPTDSLMPVDEGGFWRFGTAGDDLTLVEMKKEEYDVLIDSHATAGTPTHYSLSKVSYSLFPKPDAVFTMRLHYYAQDTDLTVGAENNWLKYASDWLMAETGIIIAEQYLQSPKMVIRFEKQALRAQNRVLTRHTALIEANMIHVMGG